MNKKKPPNLTEEMKQTKQNQEDYFKLITSGHCAICLVELNIESEMLKIIDTATCTDCRQKGWDKIFQMGLMCGRELKEWRKKNVK